MHQICGHLESPCVSIFYYYYFIIIFFCLPLVLVQFNLLNFCFIPLSLSPFLSHANILGEIFSYGHTPYDHLPPTDVLAWLEKGERLECPQPCISIPIVYEWMLKCWEYEPATRPSFSESKEFLFTQVNSSTVSGQEIRNIGQLL